MIKTCLDCKNCKIKFSINKKDPLMTSLAPIPKRINGKRVIYRSMVCKQGEWIDPNGKQHSIPYSEQNVKTAKWGKSRYLNQAIYCSFFEDMEG